jgi:hypothetical protein
MLFYIKDTYHNNDRKIKSLNTHINKYSGEYFLQRIILNLLF